MTVMAALMYKTNVQFNQCTLAQPKCGLHNSFYSPSPSELTLHVLKMSTGQKQFLMNSNALNR